MEVYIKTADVVRGLQCFDPETTNLTRQQCHVRMRSLSVSIKLPTPPLYVLVVSSKPTLKINSIFIACT